jgi:hypothetical protein
MKLLGGALAIAAPFTMTACFATVPAPFAEGTEVLPPHTTGLTLVGAGGGVGGFCKPTETCLAQFGVGGEARIRLGLRGNQELGASGYGAFVTSQGNTSSLSQQPSTTFIGGGEVSWKIALVPAFAIVAGAGALDEGGSPVVGGNVGLVVAPYTSAKGTELYTGARGSFGIPIFKGGSGATESVVVPVGFSFKSGNDVRVFLEGGLAVGFNQYRDAADPKSNQDSSYLGGYGAVGVLLMVR